MGLKGGVSSGESGVLRYFPVNATLLLVIALLLFISILGGCVTRLQLAAGITGGSLQDPTWIVR